MRLSKDKEYLVEDNVRLVDYLVLKLGVVPNSEQHKDLRSIGYIALTKAAITYDEQKGCTFATYASRVINNELFMNYRKEKKRANDISLDATVFTDKDGKELKFGERIEAPDSNFVEKIVNDEVFTKLISVILNFLKPRDKVIMLYRMADVSQAEIAEKLQISQSYISRIEKKIIRKVKEAVKTSICYKEVFSMSIMGDMYKITFASKDVSKFNQIFATLLQNLTNAATLPDFKVSCNKERIIIQVPAHPESFAFIAKIIQEIDEFNLSFVSDKDALQVEDVAHKEVEADESDDTESDAIIEAVVKAENTEEGEKIENEEADQIISDNLTTSTEVVKASLANPNSTVKRGDNLKKVREYMLSKQTFTTKELRQQFPNMAPVTINNAITLAKSKGLITSVARGEYAVKKD